MKFNILHYYLQHITFHDSQYLNDNFEGCYMSLEPTMRSSITEHPSALNPQLMVCV
jgi:hypothetical protein